MSPPGHASAQNAASEGSCSLRTAVGSIMTHGASTRRRKSSPPRDGVDPSPPQHKLRFGRLVYGFKGKRFAPWLTESVSTLTTADPSFPFSSRRSAGNSWRDNSQGLATTGNIASKYVMGQLLCQVLGGQDISAAGVRFSSSKLQGNANAHCATPSLLG